MPIFKKKPEVVLIEAVALSMKATIKKIASLSKKKLTDKDVERSSDYCSRQSGLGKWISISEGDWLVKEGKEISVYDAHEFAKNFEAQDVKKKSKVLTI
jgi:hypothetical protein